MTRVLNLSPLESPESDLNSTFNVVIAYQDFDTGKHAKKTYDFLVENLGQRCQFANQMWKFEVLSIPKLREMAARDAAMADIIMISCHGNELPPEVKAWIELWVAEPNYPIALVALFDCADKQGTHTQEVRSYLASVARRGQMEFFAQPDDWPGSKNPEADFKFQRGTTPDNQAISALAGAVQRDSSFLHWGINE
jgi:hypothetical protein